MTRQHLNWDINSNPELLPALPVGRDVSFADNQTIHVRAGTRQNPTE